jgi:hypothetical protein
MQLDQAAGTKPDQDHVSQNVLLALGDSLASPAEFERVHGPAHILLHLNQLVSCH